MMYRRISFLMVLFTLLLSACKNNDGQLSEAASEEYYTCPMHPSVVSNTPGACPVCNMALVKVERKESGHGAHEGNYIAIDKHKQHLAGIETDTVKLKSIFPSSTILGTVVADEKNIKAISSRVKGRIEKLFVKTTGVYIQKGIPLYSIYSEQLLSIQKEYLILVKKKNESPLSSEMFDAAKKKLLLLGLTEHQITELGTSTNANALITFFSPEAGYVNKVEVTEGEYVEEGSPVLKIASLSQVWVEAQVYSNELEKYNGDKNISVYTEGAEEVYSGQIAFSNPAIEPGKKIQLLRIRVDNRDHKLIPGMMVYVGPEEAGKKVLAVPKSAIVFEKMKVVWIKTGDETFEQRMIEMGIENKAWVEIISGISEGEMIVTSGAYLINSEFILKSGAAKRHEH